MPIRISLKKGYHAIVDDEDADLADLRLHRKQWKNSRTYYVYTSVKGEDGKSKSVPLHRIILERMIGRPLKKGELCDHIDGHGFNCTRDNLRIVTPSQNSQNNRGKRNSLSGYKGVYPNGNQFHAIITVEGERNFLGCFDTPLEAHKIYCIAALKFHKQYANFGPNSPFTKTEIFGLELPPPPIRENIHRHRTVINKSGLKGAYPSSKGHTWQAIATVNKKRTYVGTFANALDAHRAVCEVMVKEIGEKAYLGPNSPFTPSDFMEQEQQAA